MFIKNKLKNVKVMKNQKPRPNIYEYHDYLIFLKDWIGYLKSTKVGFNLRQLSQAAEIALGYIPMVLSRKRIMSEKTFQKILPHLKLSSNEIKYIEQLKIIADSGEPQKRVQALNNIQKLKNYKSTNRSELEVHQYLNNWYNVAIRELVNTKNFNSDPEWIQSQLIEKTPLSEIKAALTFLEKHQFILKNKDGSYYLPEKPLKCDEGIYKISLAEFHRQILKLAEKSIERFSREERTIMGHTIALNQKQHAALKQHINTFIENIAKLSDNNKEADQIYHVELAAFPLTKKQEDKK